MTGCGCLLVVALLAVLLYVFVFGSTDAGEPIESAAALAALFVAGSRLRGRRWPPRPGHPSGGLGLYAVSAAAGRRAPHAVARS